MSSILAVDTSCDACSLALLQDGKVSSRFLQAPRQHSQRLLPLIDELLREQSVKLASLDAIAYGRGPGSFTGLRICLGVVQGLAFAAELPVIPVSTLQTMARGAVDVLPLQEGDQLLVALDARMGEVYWALYQLIEGRMQPLTEEYVSAPAEVAGHPALDRPGRLYRVGAGCHYPEIAAIDTQGSRADLLPRAEHMIDLALEALSDGHTMPAEESHPVYLRNSVAWKKRERIRSR